MKPDANEMSPQEIMELRHREVHALEEIAKALRTLSTEATQIRSAVREIANRRA